MNSSLLARSNWVQFGCWFLGILAISVIIEWFAETELTQWWTILLLAFSMHLLNSSPFVKSGVPRSFEVGIATVAIMVFMLHLGMAVIYPKIEADDEDSRPCGRKTKEYQCYNLSRTVCLSAVEHYQAECNTEIRAKGSGPTQLIGSAVKRCMYDRFKKYMSYNLKLDAPSSCKE